ncbi:MAG TPA: MBL fold metallo-hydrolase [Candidatus Lokiarchaeia archaeon]|nr:MBL fold metallo-hydrolase [Candidatus Lokiarchaeia archaeon]
MKIIEDMYWYPAAKPVTHVLGRGLSMNVCAVDQGDEIWLVDAGTKPLGRPRRIVKWIEQDGMDPSKISKIFITHAHSDHVGALDFFKDKFNPEILIHEQDADFLTHAYDYYWKEQLDAAGILAKDFLPLPISFIMLFVNYSNGKVKPIPPTRALKDDEIIKGNRHDFHVIHTPGHTKGAACFYIPDTKVLFSGDLVLLNSRKAMEKPPLNAASSDFDAFRDSLMHVRELDTEILCGAHATKPIFGNDVIHAIWSKSIENLDDLKASVIALFQQKATRFIKDFKGLLPEHMWTGIDRLTAAYSAIKSLEHEGKVQRESKLFHYTGE